MGDVRGAGRRVEPRTSSFQMPPRTPRLLPRRPGAYISGSCPRSIARRRCQCSLLFRRRATSEVNRTSRLSITRSSTRTPCVPPVGGMPGGRRARALAS
eukprot:scaffold9442_cov117-Isochrysis_galbana.AAC.11